MIAVFARANHPRGYGFAGGTAHGYVVLFVRCNSSRQAEAVATRLYDWQRPFLGLDAHLYDKGALTEWYGGQFELLAVIPGNQIEHMSFAGHPYHHDSRFASRGDNRFTGIYEAEEVLAGECHFASLRYLPPLDGCRSRRLGRDCESDRPGHLRADADAV